MKHSQMRFVCWELLAKNGLFQWWTLREKPIENRSVEFLQNLHKNAVHGRWNSKDKLNFSSELRVCAETILSENWSSFFWAEFHQICNMNKSVHQHYELVRKLVTFTTHYPLPKTRLFSVSGAQQGFFAQSKIQVYSFWVFVCSPLTLF